MSALKPGTLCVINAGCPENIGLVVEVIEPLGPYGGREDAYSVRTVSGRNFHQLWQGRELVRGTLNECVTDRHKLRPLVESGDDADTDATEISRPNELATS